MLLLEAIILSVIAASTPLLLAASGELVVERSGVLNLGVEGMMIVGAACGFAGAYLSGSTLVGALCGILAGAAMAAVFGILTLGLAVNQVAAGLALTILGVGLSRLIGAGFVGTRSCRRRTSMFRSSPTFLLSAASCSARTRSFISRWRSIIAIWLFLYRSRAGLVLRAVGDNHASAHALGYPVLRIRMLAVLFGGACAGLGGAFLPLAYTPFFIPGMTAGRGWIALALVVFASWRPGRLVAGAYLFGAVASSSFIPRRFGFGIPSQLMSALPYLATVIVLVLISRTRGTAGSAAPASLGLVFVPGSLRHSRKACRRSRHGERACTGRRMLSDRGGQGASL